MLPKNNEIYRHFKGNLYKVLTLATHSETGEQMVVYQALYGDFQVYCRPLDMFVSEVDHAKYPEVTQKFRFEPVEGILNVGTSVNCESESMTKSVTEKIAEKVDISNEPGHMNATLSNATLSNATLSNATLSSVALSNAACPDATYPNSEQDTQPTTQPAKEVSEEKQDADTKCVDPLILEFLDAESISEKRNILTALHHRITDEMINTLAVVMDVVIEEGDIEDRYQQLKTCLATIEKYEIERKY